MLRCATGRTLRELHEKSAREHYRRDRISDDDVLYAADHFLSRYPLDDEDDPRRWLTIGLDQAGRALEIVTLIFDDGHELIIHAMIARDQYLNTL